MPIERTDTATSRQLIGNVNTNFLLFGCYYSRLIKVLVHLHFLNIHYFQSVTAIEQRYLQSLNIAAPRHVEFFDRLLRPKYCRLKSVKVICSNGL